MKWEAAVEKAKDLTFKYEKDRKKLDLEYRLAMAKICDTVCCFDRTSKERDKAEKEGRTVTKFCDAVGVKTTSMRNWLKMYRNSRKLLSRDTNAVDAGALALTAKIAKKDDSPSKVRAIYQEARNNKKAISRRMTRTTTLRKMTVKELCDTFKELSVQVEKLEATPREVSRIVSSFKDLRSAVRSLETKNRLLLASVKG